MADADLLVPVGNADAFGRHAPAFEPHFDAERGDKQRAAGGKAAHKGFFEMVVMAVADQDDIQRWQRGGGHQRRLEAAEHPAVGRGGGAENGVGYQVQAADARQQGGMAEPDKAGGFAVFAVFRLPERGKVGSNNRQRLRRKTVFTAEHHRRHGGCGIERAHYPLRLGVEKTAAGGVVVVAGGIGRPAAAFPNHVVIPGRSARPPLLPFP